MSKSTQAVKKNSLRSNLRYRFDNSLSKGPGVFVAWLALTGFFLAFVMSGVRYLTEGPTEIPGIAGYFERVWGTVGIIFLGGDAVTTTWWQRLISLVLWGITLTITASVIGFVTKSIAEKVDRLKRGKSPINESNHILILGWSSRIFPIISELKVANENASGAVVAVFADVDRIKMDEQINDRVKDFGTLKLVTRTGDPTNPNELSRANVENARAIIILSENPASDSTVVATVLSIRSLIPDSEIPIVVEMFNHDHAEALNHATAGQVRPILAQDVIARVTAQASRQPGLVAVILDLLDFAGEEIYFQSVPELVGHKYGESLLGFDSASIVGLRKSDGQIELNPPTSTMIEAGDQVVAIASDDDQIVFTGIEARTGDEAQAKRLATEKDPSPENVLIIGWSNMGRIVLDQVSRFLAPGSTLRITANPDLVDADELRNLSFSGINAEFVAHRGSISELTQAASGMKFDRILLLGYRENISVAEADALTMITMLLLRKLFEDEGNGVESSRIIAEIIDSRRSELAKTASVDDLVVSDNLGALMISQVAENPHIAPVLVNLFDAEGVSVNVIPITNYLDLGQSVDFRQLTALARARGESAIGYRKPDPTDPNAISLNPPKSQVFNIEAGDGLIVISGTE
jgi:Trk K+ transport system NAD-binding subunit